MNIAYLSALSAIAGSVVGGLTSGITTWLSQRAQAKAGQLAHEMSRRDGLYIVAASRKEAGKWLGIAYDPGEGGRMKELGEHPSQRGAVGSEIEIRRAAYRRPRVAERPSCCGVCGPGFCWFSGWYSGFIRLTGTQLSGANRLFFPPRPGFVRRRGQIHSAVAIFA
jgi:hypothetical protein